jgi:2-polyprenyl-6-hydroxyphenyl methylase/3-demethylubiquinone-9 3-methyltransferase
MTRNDLAIYEKYSENWWDKESPHFRTLHVVNEYRLTVFDRWIPEIKDLKIIDLGCGGGLFSKPLLERGAHVTGIDLSPASIAVCKAECEAGTFLQGDITSLPFTKNSFDGVILADVVEHLPSYREALEEAARVIKPNGFIFISTMNRTFFSKVIGVFLVETLRLVPPGTHDHKLFVTPNELDEILLPLGFKREFLQGAKPDIFKTLSTWKIHLKDDSNISITYTAGYRRH